MATGDLFREGSHVRKGGWAVLKKKRIVVTFAAMVLASLVASLLAGGAALAATKPFTDTVQGVEVSAGQIVGDTRVGVTFVGYADGRFPGVMYASLDYTPPQPVILPGGDGVNTIVGGTWSLKGPKGVVYGTFTGGTVTWNPDGTATVNATMAISGGSAKGEQLTGGTGTFVGTLSHLTFPPTVQGTLTLTPT